MVKTYPYQFDPKKRAIALRYRRGRLLIYAASLLVTLAVVLSMLASGAHRVLGALALSFPFPWLVNVLFILVILTITSLPIAFYSTYRYEHLYGLARYTLRGWVTDFIKMTLVSYVVTLIMVALLYLSFSFSPWWLFAGIFYIVMISALDYIFPFVILPFLWRTRPYQDAAMKKKILALCGQLGVSSIRNVVIIKESEKSIKPNAVFMGFGNSKEIGLFDNLLDQFTADEVETVVGHELGHYVHKDILRTIVLEAVLIIPTLIAVDAIVSRGLFGVSGVRDIAALLLFGFAFSAIRFFLMPLANAYSRRMEDQADAFALDHVRKPDAQISAEKRLADMHLSELEPNKLVEFWLYTHPSTVKRIERAAQWKKAQKRKMK